MGTKAEFDEYASNYDGMLRDPMRDGFVANREFYHRRKWLLILNFLRSQGIDSSKMEWLDVGCGKGELLGYGSAHFGRVVGCDPSSEMARNAGKIEVRVQEAPAVLPFAEEPGRVPLTREIQRVLRPNGTFCMIEHNPFNPMRDSLLAGAL